ncbi:MAG TPA: hypothetical protein VKZ93_05035, partial [Arenibacter sp.]|nr:hypothetical protein [Arenibacter sp.]
WGRTGILSETQAAGRNSPGNRKLPASFQRNNGLVEVVEVQSLKFKVSMLGWQQAVAVGSIPYQDSKFNA